MHCDPPVISAGGRTCPYRLQKEETRRRRKDGTLRSPALSIRSSALRVPLRAEKALHHTPRWNGKSTGG